MPGATLRLSSGKVRLARDCTPVVAGPWSHIVVATLVLGACTSGVEPSPKTRPPVLAPAYYGAAIDGKPIPAQVTIRTDSTGPVLGTVASVLLQHAQATTWSMMIGDGPAGTVRSYFSSRPPVVIAPDSVELYILSATDPTLAGRFSDTLLVLSPPAGRAPSPAAPASDLGAHVWHMRPGTTR